LEEEREKELERIYESGVADSFNQQDQLGAIQGAPSNEAPETSGVSKQTTETLMAGEKIVEALDLADKERETFAAYEADMRGLPEGHAMRMQPPPRNPILAAYNIEPEAYVLQIVEKIPSTALQDALLTLPFTKVMSLLVYLDYWAAKVSSLNALV